MKPRRKTLVITAACLVAATVAATATDLVVRSRVEERVVSAASCRLHARGPVTAELDSSFAGLRALTGSVGTVRVKAEGVRRQGTEMDVEAVLEDVTRDGAGAGGTAEATVPYSGLQNRLGGGGEGSGGGDAAAGMTVGSDGKNLVLSGSAGDLGLPVTVRTTLSTTADSLTVTPATIGVFGRDIPVDRVSSLPGASAFTDRLAPRTVRLDDLPAGVELTGAHAGGAGLVLSFSLNEETLGRSGGTGGSGGPAAADCSAGTA
ncbi:LmeA family phospholipid-binding protein [Streptomyces antarcticus]|uniref:LmeA family phospholipid-binding protein n=1 Tax=Streptomyces antarcticus TaxID=2996458 RepID=UPI00226E0B16|nr:MULTISPECIES: LmeA family phospholipid-binding protein [unclassified Streptomyces]MCY0943249.1 LmeA family phospholipid-binding protein [Streptomyces sp. H34-AA3]MCZ4085220.1 LmeA family phospholipid-binding protein [Streptomyces sp. H34-S5]